MFAMQSSLNLSTSALCSQSSDMQKHEKVHEALFPNTNVKCFHEYLVIMNSELQKITLFFQPMPLSYHHSLPSYHLGYLV